MRGDDPPSLAIKEFFLGRKAQFTKEQLISTALDLLAQKGLAGVTMAAISEKSGASIGSVYHRFSSRELLLAQLWVTLIRSFQTGFLEKLHKGTAVDAALYTLQWVRKHPRQAKVFLLHRREQLMKGPWPGNLRDEVMDLKNEMENGLNLFARQHFGNTSEKNMARVVFCLTQVPLSAVRSFLENDKPVPDYLDEFVSDTCQAVLGP